MISSVPLPSFLSLNANGLTCYLGLTTLSIGGKYLREVRRRERERGKKTRSEWRERNRKEVVGGEGKGQKKQRWL